MHSHECSDYFPSCILVWVSIWSCYCVLFLGIFCCCIRLNEMWVISRLAPLLAKYTSIPTTIIRGAVPFVFMGFVNSWIWIYEVPIMISRLNSGLFAAAAQIFHPLRVWGRTFLGRYPLKNPLNSDKNQTGGVYQEVLTDLSLSTTWWSGTMNLSIRQYWPMDFTWIPPQSVSLSS